jgi:hypothetical protein
MKFVEINEKMRNTKSEIRNKPEYRMSKIQNFWNTCPVESSSGGPPKAAFHRVKI